MSGLDYETVARFAQQGGTVYFGVMFVAGVTWALLGEAGHSLVVQSAHRMFSASSAS